MWLLLGSTIRCSEILILPHSCLSDNIVADLRISVVFFTKYEMRRSTIKKMVAQRGVR